jgi:hypothetical protein
MNNAARFVTRAIFNTWKPSGAGALRVAHGWAEAGAIEPREPTHSGTMKCYAGTCCVVFSTQTAANTPHHSCPGTDMNGVARVSGIQGSGEGGIDGTGKSVSSVSWRE